MSYKDKADELFIFLQDLKLEDISFEEKNDFYYSGHTGFIISVKGNKHIARWRPGQFSVPNSDDVYVYACTGNGKYMKATVIEDFKSIKEARIRLFNYLKQSVERASENYNRLNLYISKKKNVQKELDVIRTLYPEIIDLKIKKFFMNQKMELLVFFRNMSEDSANQLKFRLSDNFSVYHFVRL